MTAPALNLDFLSGDQFSYPTYGEYYEQEDGAAGTKTEVSKILELPTQPHRLKKFGAIHGGRYSIANPNLSIDELFPAGTKSAGFIDILVLGSARSVSENASSAERELMGYKRYPENWDGCGSSAPSGQVVDRAIHVLRNYPGTLPLPEPTLTSDGTVALDILDAGYRSVCTIEITSDAKAIYSISTPKGVIVDHFDFVGDSEMIAALGRISEILS